MQVLKAKLLDRAEREAAAKEASTRKSQVGSGDRSERIRTYNFPQNRVTDHRIGFTLYSLDRFMEGHLDEMIDALQKAQQDPEEMPPSDGQPPPPGPPQDQPLVDAIAELKMIRALQVRVNSRTDRYSKLLDDVDDPVGQADDAEVADALRRLGEREQKIHRITRDIVLGKNQ